MRLRILALAVAALGIGVGTATARQSEAPAAADRQSSLFRNSVGFVEGRIDGRGPYWFLIDTGANRSALDQNVARALGLQSGARTSVEGSAGTIETGTARIRRLTLPGLSVRNLQPTVYDLSGSLAPEGQRIAGILGYDALKDGAILFDRAGGRIAFAPRATAFGSLSSAVIVPFTLDNHIPRVDARINGLDVPLRLDTGAAIGPGTTIFVNITQAFFDRLRAADPTLAPYRHFTATGTGGEIRIPVVRGRSLELGGTSLTEPHLIVQQPVGYFARPDSVGFLGGYALQNYRGFIVDYPGRRLILLR